MVRPQNSSDRVDDLFALLAEHSFDFNANTVVSLREFDSGIETQLNHLEKHYIFIVKKIALFMHVKHHHRPAPNRRRPKRIFSFSLYSYMVSSPIRCRPL